MSLQKVNYSQIIYIIKGAENHAKSPPCMHVKEPISLRSTIVSSTNAVSNLDGIIPP